MCADSRVSVWGIQFRGPCDMHAVYMLQQQQHAVACPAHDIFGRISLSATSCISYSSGYLLFELSFPLVTRTSFSLFSQFFQTQHRHPLIPHLYTLHPLKQRTAKHIVVFETVIRNDNETNSIISSWSHIDCHPFILSIVIILSAWMGCFQPRKMYQILGSQRCFRYSRRYVSIS